MMARRLMLGYLQRSIRALKKPLWQVSVIPALGACSAYATMAAAAETANETTMKVALCQIMSGEDKKANIKTAQNAISEAAKNGAELVVLPECWNSPYDTTCFPLYAESIPFSASQVDDNSQPSTSFLIDIAKKNKIFLVGGSIPEVDDGKVYNTCLVIDPTGEIVAKHRKVHLFDIHVPGKITFRESETLSPGNSVTTFTTPHGIIGVAICYDIRFPELSMLMRRKGASFLVYPGAFNMTTGPAHWELLQRARAVDNQCFVAAVSPARNPSSKYQAWGHSTLVSPWGDVVVTTDHKPNIVYADIDLSKVKDIRESIPISKQKRNDLYNLKES